MKKLLWITLLLTLVLTVVACVNSPDAPQSGSAEGMTTDLSADTSTEAPTDASTEDSTEGVTEAPTEAPVDPKVQNAPLISSEDFMNPANEFRALNIEHGYPGGSIADRVQQLKDLGFGGVATNDPFTPNYLRSEESLARFNEFVQTLHAQGLRVWLYDEHGYPSGSAGDLTCEGHPEYEAVRLTQITVKGSGSTQQTVAVPDAFVKVECASLETNGSYRALEVTVEGGQMTFKGTDGDWVAYIYCATKYNLGFEWNNSYPNILNRDAVARFIEVTFDTYEGAVENFSEVIEAVFDDEAQLLAVHHIVPAGLTNPVLPYDYDIFDTFEKKFGYDLRPLLPLVYNSDSDEAIRLRAHFYAHIGDLVSENFFGQVQAWCKAHGITLSGHLLLEEQMMYHVPVYGNYIQCAQNMGFPGFDVLSPRPKAYMDSISTGGKYASSSAWLTGQRRVMVEIAPAADPDEFATNHLDYALGSMTFAYFDGGNQITSYYGQASADYATGKAFNEYVGRMGSITVDALNKTGIAIYYSVDTVAGKYISPENQYTYNPSSAARACDETVNSIVKSLRESARDYVFLDSVSLQRGTAEGGALKVGDFTFRTIIVPKATVMRIEDMRMLDTLISQGCEVIFVGEMPSLAFHETDQAELEELSERHKDGLVKKFSRSAREVSVRFDLTVESKQTVYVSPYEKNGATFFFLANAAPKTATMTFTYEGAVGYRLYDPVTGEITEIAADAVWEMPSYRALFVQPLLAE
ncbi:MAG: hypothetical protein IJ363_06245 [Clostridia bacterium]|nr:hypothetical protein [Clostridia bacterium]